MMLVAICLVIPQRVNVCVYLAPLQRYGASKIMGWPFGVTWRHWSRDHTTPKGRLPMGGPQWSWFYLAPLWRYGRSSRKALLKTEVGRRSILNITLISYTPLSYFRNVACKE